MKFLMWCGYIIYSPSYSYYIAWNRLTQSLFMSEIIVCSRTNIIALTLKLLVLINFLVIQCQCYGVFLSCSSSFVLTVAMFIYWCLSVCWPSIFDILIIFISSVVYLFHCSTVAVMAHVCAPSMQKKEVVKIPIVTPLDTLRHKLRYLLNLRVMMRLSAWVSCYNFLYWNAFLFCRQWKFSCARTVSISNTSVLYVECWSRQMEQQLRYIVFAKKKGFYAEKLSHVGVLVKEPITFSSVLDLQAYY